ncbi:MAG: hypothetical protein F4X36_14060 [Gammaproteobacteria bacterium]|nr:hypothetical protein [Gammaproteobacteria bacterium]
MNPKTKLEPGQMFGCWTRDEARALRRLKLSGTEWFYATLLRSYDMRRGVPFEVTDEQLRDGEHGETLRRAVNGLVSKGVITVTKGGPKVPNTYQFSDLNAHESVGESNAHESVGESAHESVGESAHESVGDEDRERESSLERSLSYSEDQQAAASTAPEPVEAGTGTDDSADPWDWQAAHDAGATYMEITRWQHQGRTAEELLAFVEERAGRDAAREQQRAEIEANREELMRERGLTPQPEQQQGVRPDVHDERSMNGHDLFGEIAAVGPSARAMERHERAQRPLIDGASVLELEAQEDEMEARLRFSVDVVVAEPAAVPAE